VPTVLGALLHHPALAAKWLEFSNVLLAAPSLGARNRELLVLRVAWRTRAWCEWAQHVLMAPRCDIAPADIDAIATDTFAPEWTDLECDLVAAADELLDGHRVEDATWDRLATVLDERQLVEVVFTVGSYLALALAFNSFDLELEDGLDLSTVPRFPD
jgi:alkylhydroperoxidase family enzyme